jgi:V/A-type H+/Na+-transporting ATPase subunit I
MIVSMKKIFVIVQRKDCSQALERLRALGVVHVEHQQAPENNNIVSLKEGIDKLERVIQYLSERTMSGSQNLDQWSKRVEDMIMAMDQIAKINEDMTKRQSLIITWEPWGEFGPQDVEEIRSNGLWAELMKIPESALKNLSDQVVCQKIFIREKIAYCLVVSQEKPNLDFEEIPLPAMSLVDMKKAQAADSARVKHLDEELNKNSVYLDSFKKILVEQRSQLQLQEALAGMGHQETLSYLKGFCPEESCDALQAVAKEASWAVIIDEPLDNDQVPTLLRNPRWVEMIKPVLGVINVLPGYKEQDISTVFLLFFSLFFGILIGDAGYGLFFALTTAFVHWKHASRIKDKTPFYLMYILSATTVFWGLLTGTFFGQTLFSGIKPLVPWLSDANNVQRFCFFIGALHLSIAHVWRAVLKFPSSAILGELGWLCLLWGMFFMARVLVLGDAMAQSAQYLFMIGPVLVLFFSKPNRNPLKSVAGGLGDLALNVVNTFTDIVSYIRLFAVGLATVAVADAFNLMALDLGFSNMMAGFFSALILVVGHVFNMILGAMAILVHGIRLNVLEFSSHMNLEWAGIKYSPLQKSSQEKV